MTMTAKFNGNCKACGCFLPAGSKIDYVRGIGARHVTVNDCAAAKAAKAASYAAAPKVTANGSPIADFLRAARERGLKFPKVAFLGPNNAELSLSLAGSKSSNPGAVFVKVDGEFVGSICADNSVRGRLANRAELLALLNTIAAAPAVAAAAYGKMRGACSFCRKSLTDDRSGSSVEVGYGPVCAKKYGLPHHPAGKAKALAPVVAVVPEPEAAPVVGESFQEPADRDCPFEDLTREDYPGQYIDGPEEFGPDYSDGPQEPAETVSGPASWGW